MGYIFRRTKGRAWLLREQSMNIWPKWINQLKTFDSSIEITTPLALLAKTKEESNFMKILANEKKEYGVEFSKGCSEIWPKKELPEGHFGGLVSHQDGRIDPKKLQKCLANALNENNVRTLENKVVCIKRNDINKSNKWKIITEEGIEFEHDTIVVCAALGSEELIKPLGHPLKTKAVLGQAVEIELKDNIQNWSKWPAVLVFNGINLIPRKENELILGATLENSIQPSQTILQNMLLFNGMSPNWLKEASVKNCWYGLRCKPMNEPAPILKILEDGLILATAHYRNGILLAPATAEWVGKQIST